MASNANPQAPRTTAVPPLADGGGGDGPAAKDEEQPQYYVMVILTGDYERLPDLMQKVQDGGCVIVNNNCTLGPHFSFLTPKGVPNPIEDLAAAPGSKMQVFVNKAKKCLNPEAAQPPPQLEQLVFRGFGNEY